MEIGRYSITGVCMTPGNNRVYTGRGDKGDTILISGYSNDSIINSNSFTSKDAPVVEALGTLDELSSWMGYLRIKLKKADADFVESVQRDIYKISGYIAGGRHKPMLDARVEMFEKLIDDMGKDLERLRAFIYPGGTEISALIHIVRTVCRRAERRVVSLRGTVDQDLFGAMKYLNRLSDYLFVLARKYNKKERVEKVMR